MLSRRQRPPPPRSMQINAPNALNIPTHTNTTVRGHSGHWCVFSLRGQRREAGGGGERSRRRGASQSPEVSAAREECFQPASHTRALSLKDAWGHAPAQAHQSTLTGRPMPKVYSPQIGLSIIYRPPIISHSDHLGQRQSPPSLSSLAPASLEDRSAVSDRI